MYRWARVEMKDVLVARSYLRITEQSDQEALRRERTPGDID